MSLMFLVGRRDADAVVRRLSGLAYTCCEGFYAPGLTQEDLMQVARVGIAQAVRDFKGREQHHFVAFAALCAKRQVMTAVKLARAGKHSPLADARSMDAQIETEDGAVEPRLMLFRERDDPAHIVIALDEARRLLRSIGRLTPLEREAVRRCLILGEPYKAVDDNYKRIDNAILRARRKLAEPEPQELPTGQRRFYLDRTIHPTQRSAERTALDMVPGRIVECVARKLIDGRERDPRGRPDSRGRRGHPVWRVVVEPETDARRAA